MKLLHSPVYSKTERSRFNLCVSLRAQSTFPEKQLRSILLRDDGSRASFQIFVFLNPDHKTDNVQNVTS